MTDRRLAQLARKYKEGQQAEAEGKTAKSNVLTPVLTELDRRGTKTITTNGVKITKVEPEETIYDWDALAEVLSVRQMRSIQKEEVDRTKLAEAVQSGKIDAALVAQCTEVKSKGRYISVTFVATPRQR